MGSSGGDNNIFGDGNFLNGSNLLETAVNVGLLGLVGIKDGKLEKGFVLQGLDEGLGEVTGRNAARKQMMMAEDQIRADAATRAQDLKDQQAAAASADKLASDTAAATRKKTTSSTPQTSSRTITATPNIVDYLGL